MLQANLLVAFETALRGNEEQCRRFKWVLCRNDYLAMVLSSSIW
jgi:hypothetical protein